MLGALACLFFPGVAAAQPRAAVPISSDRCVAPARAELDDALALELRTLPEDVASWTVDARTEARLRCSGRQLRVYVTSGGEPCGGESRLEAARVGTDEFPRLAALTIVELVESCYEVQRRAADGEPDAPSEVPQIAADAAVAPDAVGEDDLHDPEGAPDEHGTRDEPAAQLGAPDPTTPRVGAGLGVARAIDGAPHREDADGHGQGDAGGDGNADRGEAARTDAGRDERSDAHHDASRWTLAPVIGVVLSPRARLAEPVGGLDVTFVPRTVLGFAASAQVGGMRHTAQRAVLRHRFVRVGVFGMARLTGRPLALSVGLGYVLALDRFIGDPVDPLVVGERRTVLQGGPALRVGLDGLRRGMVIPLRLDVGWMAPRARLRDEVGALLLTWGGLYVTLTVGLGAARGAVVPAEQNPTPP